MNLSEPEMAFALEAVAIASRMTRRVQEDRDVQGLSKEDKSPVTVADFASQAVVARALRSALTQVVSFVREIAPDAEPDRVCDWIDVGNGTPSGRYWTLDPIDGTKGYLRREQYAVALALIEAGQVVLGVLGCPALGPGCALDAGPAGQTGILVAARRGQGAFCAPFVEPASFARLRVSDREDIRDARWLRSVEKGHTNLDQMGQLAESLGVEAPAVGLDSQAKYAVLAAGGGDVLLRLLSPSRPDYRECIWDQAAGSIVVEEAGGMVTDLDGKPLDFSHGTRLERNRGICATNGRLHEAMLAALAMSSPVN